MDRPALGLALGAIFILIIREPSNFDCTYTSLVKGCGFKSLPSVVAREAGESWYQAVMEPSPVKFRVCTAVFDHMSYSQSSDTCLFLLNDAPVSFTAHAKRGGESIMRKNKLYYSLCNDSQLKPQALACLFVRSTHQIFGCLLGCGHGSTKSNANQTSLWTTGFWLVERESRKQGLKYRYQ